MVELFVTGILVMVCAIAYVLSMMSDKLEEVALLLKEQNRYLSDLHRLNIL